MRDLAASEAQRDLAFISVIQEALDVAHLDVVVTVVCARPKLNFFDLDHFLLGLRFRCLFLLLVLELAVVHQTTDGGHCCCSYFNQIHIDFTGHAQGFCQAHDA